MLCHAQVVFQKPKDDFQQQMMSRNDPSAPVPVEVPQESRKEQIAQKPYQFLLVSRLREYLALEFNVQAPFPVDPERIYDDFGARSCLSLCWLTRMRRALTCSCCDQSPSLWR